MVAAATGQKTALENALQFFIVHILGNPLNYNYVTLIKV